jgi:heat shock protein HtpX
MDGIHLDIWRAHALLNRLQSALLLGSMAGLLALLGWLVWGGAGVILLLLAGATMLLLNPVIAPELIMRLYGAMALAPHDAPDLYRALAELARRADLPVVPRLYYVPSRVLNAFAVGGRSRAGIGITAGLVQGLGFRELVGVLAHEISHIRSNDLWVMGVADMFSRMTSVLSLMGQLLLVFSLPLWMMGEFTVPWFAIIVLILAPSLSALVQLGLSRTREYHADLNAAALTGDPEGLASALRRMERIQGPWIERIFLPGRRMPDPSLLRTHPRTDERIRRLMALKPMRQPGVRWLDPAARTWSVGVEHPAVRKPRWHLNGLWY